MDSKTKHHLKKQIEYLDGIRGRHTELVTVYVPSGYEISKVMQQLKDEQGTATNIKSKSTRKNVLGALEKVISHLRLFPRTPPNGLVVFSGNISNKEGVSNIQLYSLEPPEPISVRIYRCDQEFVLDPLKELIEDRDIYALLILERNEATIGTLKGKHIEMLERLTSGVPGKSRAGGQSSVRFARLREEAAKEFNERVAEHFNRHFHGMEDLKGIIIGGPGLTKDKFVESSCLHYELQDKILGTLDTVYTEEYGLRELVEKAEDILSTLEITEEKKVMSKFFKELVNDTGLAAYGEKEVMHFLKIGAIDTLLISEAVDITKLTLACGNCNFKKRLSLDTEKLKNLESELSQMKCPECGNYRLNIIDKIDLEKEFAEISENMNTKVSIISTETEEGKQLLQAFGGIAAILRYSGDAPQ